MNVTSRFGLYQKPGSRFHLRPLPAEPPTVPPLQATSKAASATIKVPSFLPLGSIRSCLSPEKRISKRAKSFVKTRTAEHTNEQAELSQRVPRLSSQHTAQTISGHVARGPNGSGMAQLTSIPACRILRLCSVFFVLGISAQITDHPVSMCSGYARAPSTCSGGAVARPGHPAEPAPSATILDILPLRRLLALLSVAFSVLLIVAPVTLPLFIFSASPGTLATVDATKLLNLSATSPPEPAHPSSSYPILTPGPITAIIDSCSVPHARSPAAP